MPLNAVRFLETYSDIMKFGLLRSPRGQLCRDLMNGSVILDLNDSPCTSFEARKFNLTYAKAELLWYIGADPYADWIQDYATAWKKLKQPSGNYFSNYGQYLFRKAAGGEVQKSQFEYVVESLIQDKDSRRAVMVLLQPYHLFHDNVDTVCTYALQFAIYDDELFMTVMMRSNDAIWGMSNDVFCFWCIAQMVYALLKEHYPELKRGTYTHIANSLHIYERHFEMTKKILDDNLGGYTPVDVPFITAAETRKLLALYTGDWDDGQFSSWLTLEPR